MHYIVSLATQKTVADAIGVAEQFVERFYAEEQGQALRKTLPQRTNHLIRHDVTNLDTQTRIRKDRRPKKRQSANTFFAGRD